MLEAQVVSVSLAQGMDTKTDPKQVTSQYLLVQNAIYNTLEQLNPRSGFVALSTGTYVGGSITAGLGLAALNQALVLHDGTSVYSRIGDLTEWTTVGQKQAVTVTSQSIGSYSSPIFASVGMCRASNGLELYVWIDRNGTYLNGSNYILGIPYYSVFDTINNVTVTSGQLSISGEAGYANLRCEVVGSNFYIVATTGTKLYYWVEPISAPDFSTGSRGLLDGSVSFNFIDTVASSSALYVLGAKVYKIVGGGTITTSAASTYGTVANACIGFDAATNNVWIANSTGSQVKGAVLNANLGVVAALQNVGAALPGGPFNGAFSLYVNNNTAYVVIPGALNPSFATVTLSGSTLTGSIGGSILGVQVCSKPLLRSDGYLYFIGIFISNYQGQNPDAVTTPAVFNPTQPTTFLIKVRASTLNVANNIFPTVVAKSLALETGNPYGLELNAGTASFYNWAPNALIQVDANNLEFPNLQTTQDITGAYGSVVSPSSVIVRTLFQFGNKIRRDALANNIHSTGGYISSYDGNIEVEHMFHLYPEILQAVKTIVSSGVPIGTYSYVAVFRWNDSQGQIHRSAPSTPLSVNVTSANTQVALTISNIPLTDKPNYYIDLYRTASAGTIYYFVESLLVSSQALSSTSVLNDVNPSNTASTIELYTTGGEVDNISAPATSYMTDFKNRIFTIPSENPYSIWYSKQVITNFPVEFAQEFTLNLEARGGPATALAPLDDKLIIFKQTSIFYIVGDGPAPSGANNDFSYPQTIPSDSGCTEPDSVVGFPEGVLFKGSKGIYLLGRSLQVQYIGAAVEAYNQYTITSSVVDYNLQIIRYTLSNGVSLVYDYYVKRWSVFTNISAVDSVIANGVYSYLGANGVVQQETPGVYSDNGSVISMGLITGWLSFAHIQGFQRLRNLELLGKCYSPNTLSISFAYDFNPTVTQVQTITNTAAVDPWEYGVSTARQKCTAVQITLTVTPSDTSGAALALSDIGLEIGVKRGLNKLAPDKNV